MAASAALPPFSSILTPASVAKGRLDATIPAVDKTGDRLDMKLSLEAIFMCVLLVIHICVEFKDCYCSILYERATIDG